MAVGSDPRIGTALAGYRIEEPLGRGGMGVVYRAHDDALERSVALKLIRPELASDTAFRDRFLVEARLAASLDHPNVIPVYDAGAIDGQLYLAMRFVEGSNLRELLAEGPLEPERALAVCGQVAAALDAAHRRELVHRDVKPSNVLLDEDGHTYLADFGLTRRLSEQAPGFDAGLSLGTPAYVAPEQIESAGGAEAQVGPRADQYSLACLLYECLAGQPPFPRATEAATLFAHLEEEPPALAAPEAVLARGLAKDPEDRFETCTGLIEAAREALPHKRRRRRLLSAAVLAALAAAATVAAVVAATGGDSPRIGHDWSKVPHNEAAFGGTQGTFAENIATDGSILVATGATGGTLDSGSDAVVWTSTDGKNWTLNTDESLVEEGWQFPQAVTAGPLGFAMVGIENLTVEPGAELSGDFDAAVWRSRDGMRWERVADDEGVFGGPGVQNMLDVVAGGPGLIAVGNEATDPSGLTVGAVWTSPDGVRWSRVTGDPETFEPIVREPNRFTWMQAAAVGRDGQVVAVGMDTHTPNPGTGLHSSSIAAVWFSADGESWQRVAHDDSAFGDGATVIDVFDVTEGGPGFVAIGLEQRPNENFEGGFPQDILRNKGHPAARGIVVTSEDGLVWSRVPDNQLPDGGAGALLWSVRATEQGLVTVGFRRDNPGTADAEVDPIVWISTDGTTWTEAADPGGVFDQPGGQALLGIAEAGPGLVAIGLDGGLKSHNTAIWTSP